MKTANKEQSELQLLEMQSDEPLQKSLSMNVSYHWCLVVKKPQLSRKQKKLHLTTRLSLDMPRQKLYLL